MTIKKKIENLNLEGLRLLSGKTIAEVSELVKLSTRTYRTYERSPDKFTIEQALKLCALFEIDIDDFLKLRGIDSNESDPRIQE